MSAGGILLHSTGTARQSKDHLNSRSRSAIFDPVFSLAPWARELIIDTWGMIAHDFQASRCARGSKSRAALKYLMSSFLVQDVWVKFVAHRGILGRGERSFLSFC